MVGVTYPTVFNFFFCLLFKIAFRVVRVTFNKRYLFAYAPDQSFVQVKISFISDDQFFCLSNHHYYYCCYYYCYFFGITSPLHGEKSVLISESYPLSEIPRTLLMKKVVPSNAVFCKQLMTVAIPIDFLWFLSFLLTPAMPKHQLLQL